MPYQAASQVLSHIKVLDLTRVRSGPTAVRQLADWGADVIKIEAPGAQGAENALGASRHSPDFQNLHRNKRSMTINLKHPDGKALFMRLVKDADVVVENFRPGVKQRLGIDYDQLSSVNPRVILASISGFGQTGPYRDRPGFDQIAQGMGGLQSITGEPGRGPMRVGIPVADLTAGLFCAQGILLALIEREKSGQGQWLYSSLLEAQIFMLDFQAARWLMGQEVPPQAGNDHPTSIPTGLFRTRDGALNLAASGDLMWRRLCEAFDRADWLDDPRYITDRDRSTNRADLNAEIQKIFAERSTAEWVELLTDVGVPCGPVYNIDDTFADPQVEHLGIAREIKTEAFGTTHCVGQPVTLARTPSSIVARSPERGEHTNEILNELNLSADEIEAMRKQSVI